MRHGQDEARPYEVIIAPSAVERLQEIRSQADKRQIDKVICLLDTVPEIGRRYDPLYEAARLEGDVRVVYAGHYGIYYEINEAGKVVSVHFIEDQRSDPRLRFLD